VAHCCITIVLLSIVTPLASGQWNRPDDISAPSGMGGGAGDGIAPGVSPLTSYLRMYLEIDCFDAERDNIDGLDPRYVIGSRKEFFDGDSSPIYNYQEKYPHRFIDDSWPVPGPAGLIQNVDLNSAKYNRYEARPDDGGGCYAFAHTIHEEYQNSVFTKTFDLFGWQQVSKDIFYYNVDWDNNQASCQAVGGLWLQDGSYDGYRCCGDDWIWLNNRPLNYAARGYQARLSLAEQDLLCLHSDINGSGYGSGMSGEHGSEENGYDFGTDSYYCDSPPGNVAYDRKLKLDDELELTYARSDQDYYFVGQGSTETDLGKWSDFNGENPRFCNVLFDNNPGKGVTFEWLDITVAANKNQAICELYLGYNWTGSTCCGAPGNAPSYNDVATECDAQPRANQLVAAGVPLSHITFQQRFGRLCNTSLIKNRACYDRKTVENNSIAAFSDATPDLRNILNVNGTLSICQAPQMPAGFEVVDKCGFRGDIDNFAVCAYSNDSWYKRSDTLFYDLLGFLPSPNQTFDDIKNSLHESDLPDAVSGQFNQKTECCLNNACWNGKKCVSSESTFELFNSQWGEFDGNVNPGKEVYRCRNGTWNGPLQVQYDWNFDNEHPGFCIDSTQCYCTECPVGSHDNGCTKTPGFFTGDHFCENRVWTSRTKLLAIELMQLAGSNEFTLFCDKYDKSINYFEPLKQIPEKVNNFCVINYSGTVILGVTFNPDGVYPAALDINAVLTDQTNGFAHVMLDDDIENCDNAVTNAATGSYGSYKRCMNANDKYWYNNKTETLLYSKTGLAGDEFLQPNQSTTLDTQFATIRAYIDANAAATSVSNLDTLKNARNFNRIYVSRDGGSTVFAVNEGRYDDALDQVRYFLGASYAGVSGIDCAGITRAYPTAQCGTTGSTVVVLAKNADENFKYWTDLSAKLRYR
jgi:hypothetical protein